MNVDPKIVDSLTKAGIAFVMAAIVAGIVFGVLYFAHQERIDARRDDRDRLLPILEKLAESTDTIARTYSGK